MPRHPLDAAWNPAAVPLAGQDLCGIVRRVHSQGEAPERSTTRKTAAPRQQPGSDFVEALGHGLAVLECWQPGDVWLGNSEIAQRAGLTRTSVTRLTAVLVDLGYLVRDMQRRGRLRLTSATLGLGFGSALAAPAVSAAQLELARLASELDVYAAFSIRRIDKIQILENVASPLHPDAVVMDVGGMLPICRSGSGLAAMAALPDEQASPLIYRLKLHYGDRWKNLERQVTKSRQEYSSRGYCTSVAVLSQDVGAVAIPIVPAGTDDIFVLACGMSAANFYAERVERSIAPRMLEVARTLRESLSN